VKYVPPYGVTANPDASYINGDPSIGRQGSIPPAAVFENPQREICNLITDSAQTPIDQDLHQLTRGVRDGKLNFCVDSGPLNQLQVQIPGPALQSYTAGLVINVLVAHTNTGPTRISVGTLNPTSVKRPDGSELQANDLLAGMVATLVCDGTFFQCINISTGATGGGDTTIFQTDIPYVHDTGTPNHVVGLYSPPLPDIREGRTVEVKLYSNVTGPTDFTPNNFPTHPVAHPDGSPIKAGDGVVNQIWLLCFDGVQWQLLGVYFSTPVTPVTPVGGSQKSLQFKRASPSLYTNYTCTKFIRYPSMNTNRQIWTISWFGKWPNSRKLDNVTGPWDDGHDEYIIVSAGNAAAAPYTGCAIYGTPAGNSPVLAWNTSMNIVAGMGTAPLGNVSVGFYVSGIMMDTRWHHFLCNVNGAQMSFFIDGVLTAQGSVSGDGMQNSTQQHCWGTDAVADGWNDWAGIDYIMAELVQIDGQCLTWDKFANNIGGNIVPKDVTGLNFGPNGSYLNFSDSSAVTTTTLGRDYSGNNNHWTPRNFTLANVLTDYPGK
jgi:hypothetical protein